MNHMNKQKIDDKLLDAYHILISLRIADGNGVVAKGFRSQISSFGSAVLMGNVTAAVKFFSKADNSVVDRQKLMIAIYLLIKNTDGHLKRFTTIPQGLDKCLLECCKSKEISRDQVLEAAITIKLALNMFQIAEESNEGEKENE